MPNLEQDLGHSVAKRLRAPIRVTVAGGALLLGLGVLAQIPSEASDGDFAKAFAHGVESTVVLTIGVSIALNKNPLSSNVNRGESNTQDDDKTT